VLFLQQRVLTLQRLELFELARRSRGHHHPPRSAPEHAVSHFLSPARQHEGMDVEGVGDRLHFDSGMWLSFTAVNLNSTL